MPSAIVATVGGISSNSYLTEAAADAYFGDRLHAARWTAASSTDKVKALLWATKLLDSQVTWAGVVADYDQALAWPRTGVLYLNSQQEIPHTSIPAFLQYAQAELALTLVSTDVTLESDSAGISSLSVPGAVSLTFDKTTTPPVLPRQVRDLIAPYGVFDNGSKMRVLNVARS
jgi:hypothetical protein